MLYAQKSTTTYMTFSKFTSIIWWSPKVSQELSGDYWSTILQSGFHLHSYQSTVLKS